MGLLWAILFHVSGAIASFMSGHLFLRKCILRFATLGHIVEENGHIADPSLANGCLVFTCRIMLKGALFYLGIAYVDIECLIRL